MAAAVLHPTLIALLLTLAAIGTPLAGTAGGFVIGTTRVVESHGHSIAPRASHASGTSAEFAQVQPCAARETTPACATLTSWVTHAPLAGLAATPPPSC